MFLLLLILLPTTGSSNLSAICFGELRLDLPVRYLHIQLAEDGKNLTESRGPIQYEVDIEQYSSLCGQGTADIQVALFGRCCGQGRRDVHLPARVGEARQAGYSKTVPQGGQSLSVAHYHQGLR